MEIYFQRSFREITGLSQTFFMLQVTFLILLKTVVFSLKEL